ncbi:MAG: DUF5698 domain-containing protein [Caldiserica bacterium]|nr:DUF5698 domain-containing protein [Caldisericota bacterium]
MEQFWVIAESFTIVFVVKFVNMALQTLSMNFLIKGRRLYTFIFAFLEVMVYLVGLSQVLNNMTIYKMLGYAFGYATGALFGIWLEQKLAIGNQTWLIIPNDNPYRLAYYLRDRGFGITTISGSGMDSNRTIILTTTMRKNIALLSASLAELAPDAFVSVLDTRTTMGGHVNRIPRG